jgi:pyridoxamine 5'-phosphate oxidase
MIAKKSMSASTIVSDPFKLFQEWWAEYKSKSVTEDTPMCLSTVSPQTLMPSSRMVLLKSFSDDGFVFYTNYGSRKAAELALNPNCSLLFYWNSERQVRVEGEAFRVSDEESQKYFDSRPVESRIASLASKQSHPMVSKEEFTDRIDAVRKQNNLICSGVWGGFRVKASRFEFWVNGENRVHDRTAFENVNGICEKKKLFP